MLGTIPSAEDTAVSREELSLLPLLSWVALTLRGHNGGCRPALLGTSCSTLMGIAAVLSRFPITLAGTDQAAAVVYRLREVEQAAHIQSPFVRRAST